MKIRKTLFLTALMLLGLAGLNASAQLPGSGPSGGVNATLLRLFGNLEAFTAEAQIRVFDTNEQELSSTPVHMERLDDKMRFQMDLAQMQSVNKPPGMAATLKKMGMDQVVSILRPDRQVIYIFWPGPKALLSVPLAAADAQLASRQAKVTKTPQGKENIEGHPCVKNKVVISDAQGHSVEAVTWNAADLKNFPLQIQTQERGNRSVILFSHVQFAAPAAGRFDPPSGYTEYHDAKEMMVEMLKNLEQSQSAAPAK